MDLLTPITVGPKSFCREFHIPYQPISLLEQQFSIIQSGWGISGSSQVQEFCSLLGRLAGG